MNWQTFGICIKDYSMKQVLVSIYRIYKGNTNEPEYFSS